MNHCKDCKFWEKSDIDEYERWSCFDWDKQNLGHCDYDKANVKHPFKMVSAGDGVFQSFITAENFGCVLFKKKK